ncbi:ferredoxin Fer [Halobaculum sp. EA56]|uniref:ferredoxin Fer n=1 Tax=Halobaculum sp. EA56 TaxID=3421648 RepID=UPI003EBD9FAC
MDSPYEVLGVDADADDTEIERAYRRRVKEAHPDRGGSAAEFQRVREAYEAAVSGEAAPPTDPGPAASPRRDGAAGEGGGPGSNAGTAGRGRRRRDRSPPAGSGAARESRVEYLDYEVLADRGWELDDPDLFEKAGEADLDADDYGVFLAEPGETLLEAAENRGFEWPYACRGGACANCAVAVVDGDLGATVDNVLTDEMTADGFRLSCIGEPVTDDLRVVFNVKHLPGLEELRLPADRFERARADD